MIPLPSNQDAEEAVLSAILMDSEAINALHSLKPDAFYKEGNRRMYEAMRELQASGKTIDPLTLTSELERMGALQVVGGKDYISYLLDAIPSAANVEHHAQLIKTAHARRGIIALAQEAIAAAEDPTTDVQKVAAQLQQDALPFAVETDKRGFRHMREIMYDTLEEIEARGNAAREGRVLGVTTGYPEIDDITNGFRQGELVSIFGGPKCGKTAFTLAVALHNALNGEGCGFVCAEMTAGSLAERCINAVGRIKTAETSRGLFSGTDWQNVVKVAGRVAATRFFVDDEAFPELGDVISRGLHLKSQNKDLKLLVVDYLQLVTHRMKGRRGDEEINEVCKGLKGLAKRAQLTIIAPGQTNYKDVDARAIPRPTIRDVQGASGPAQTSDFLFLAYRDPMSPESFELELGASRRTDRFTAQLTWAGQYMRVESSRAIQFARTTWEGGNAA